MLVLTRKARETIQIGEDIVITIVRFKGQAVQVGVEAPREIRVRRGEVKRLPAEDAACAKPATTEASPEEDAAEAGEGQRPAPQRPPLRRALVRAMKGSPRLPLSRRPLANRSLSAR